MRNMIGCLVRSAFTCPVRVLRQFFVREINGRTQARPKLFRKEKRFGNEFTKRGKHLGKTKEQEHFVSVDPFLGPLRFQETFPGSLCA